MLKRAAVRPLFFFVPSRLLPAQPRTSGQFIRPTENKTGLRATSTTNSTTRGCSPEQKVNGLNLGNPIRALGNECLFYSPVQPKDASSRQSLASGKPTTLK